MDGLSQIERDLHQLKVQERYKKKEQMDRFKHLKKPLRTQSAFHISEDKYEMIRLANKYPNNPKMQDYKKKLLELEEDNDCKFQYLDFKSSSSDLQSNESNKMERNIF